MDISDKNGTFDVSRYSKQFIPHYNTFPDHLFAPVDYLLLVFCFGVSSFLCIYYKRNFGKGTPIPTSWMRFKESVVRFDGDDWLKNMFTTVTLFAILKPLSIFLVYSCDIALGISCSQNMRIKWKKTEKLLRSTRTIFGPVFGLCLFASAWQSGFSVLATSRFLLAFVASTFLRPDNRWTRGLFIQWERAEYIRYAHGFCMMSASVTALLDAQLVFIWVPSAVFLPLFYFSTSLFPKWVSKKVARRWSKLI